MEFCRVRVVVDADLVPDAPGPVPTQLDSTAAPVTAAVLSRKPRRVSSN
jgi:hypothetical protein